MFPKHYLDEGHGMKIENGVGPMHRHMLPIYHLVKGQGINIEKGGLARCTDICSPYITLSKGRG